MTKSNKKPLTEPKFSEGEEIVDKDFGRGRIIAHSEWDDEHKDHMYRVCYYRFGKDDQTWGCNESAMKPLSKLERVLK